MADRLISVQEKLALIRVDSYNLASISLFFGIFARVLTAHYGNFPIQGFSEFLIRFTLTKYIELPRLL